MSVSIEATADLPAATLAVGVAASASTSTISSTKKQGSVSSSPGLIGEVRRGERPVGTNALVIERQLTPFGQHLVVVSTHREHAEAMHASPLDSATAKSQHHVWPGEFDKSHSDPKGLEHSSIGRSARSRSMSVIGSLPGVECDPVRFVVHWRPRIRCHLESGT